MNVYLKFIRLFLVLMVGVFFLVGSCISGDCEEPTKVTLDDTKTEVKLDVKDLNIILPQKSRQFKKKSNSFQNSQHHALILTDSSYPSLLTFKLSK